MLSRQVRQRHAVREVNVQLADWLRVLGIAHSMEANCAAMQTSALEFRSASIASCRGSGFQDESLSLFFENKR